MDDNATGSAGLVPNDGRRAADHPAGDRSGALDRATDRLTAALEILAYGNKFEQQEAKALIREAQDFISEARAAGEGIRGG